MDLFNNTSPEIIQPQLPEADITYIPGFISQEKADGYYQKFLEEVPWQQDDIVVYGKKYAQPRLTALYGEASKSYSYSGIKMSPKVFTPEMLELKQKIESLCDVNFTTVLLNLYRDGSDSNGWHSDDEKELGTDPCIASLSLGETRVFHFRHKKDKSIKYKLQLEHGSLLIMKGSTQHFWQHQLPKTKKKIGSRINLTYRVIR